MLKENESIETLNGELNDNFTTEGITKADGIADDEQC
jgi:hypothetical protein